MSDPTKERTADTTELLRGVRRRHPDSLAAFFEAHFDRLYNVAYRLVGDHGLAEDVMQDVFLKIHRAADRIDLSRDPGPWLATLTRNACREQWRKRKRHVEGVGSLGDRDEEVAASNDPEAEAMRSETSRWLGVALMRLPEPLREVIVFRDFCELPHEEIATIVGARIATVRKRYSRALAELRRSLEDAPL